MSNIKNGTLTHTNLNYRFIAMCKCIIFLAILVILWNNIFNVLSIDPSPITSFYKEPKNSMDILYLGASNAFGQFNNTLAYHLYGYTAGFLASSNQPFAAIRHLIEEAKMYQSPQLYVIDIGTVVMNLENSDFYTEEVIRLTTDSMKFSINRINAINELLGYTNVSTDKYISHYFDFLIYHNRWKNITSASFIGDSTYYKGYHFYNGNINVEPHDNISWSENTISLDSKNKNVLLDLINYIKDNNLNVLFIVPIKYYDSVSMEKMNDAINTIEDNNLNLLNLNTVDNLKIDLTNELYDINHMNISGATKFTLYLAGYLKQNYNLPDHRNDIKYSSWESEYERFKKSYKYLTNSEFDILLEKSKNENSGVFV